MNRIAKTFRTTALKIAIPAIFMGVALLICSPLVRAQTCVYGQGNHCPNRKDDPDPVPEPSMLLQLGTGLSALAIVGRRLVAKKS
jgi:hypothetical protein